MGDQTRPIRRRKHGERIQPSLLSAALLLLMLLLPGATRKRSDPPRNSSSSCVHHRVFASTSRKGIDPYLPAGRLVDANDRDPDATATRGATGRRAAHTGISATRTATHGSQVSRRRESRARSTRSLRVSVLARAHRPIPLAHKVLAVKAAAGSLDILSISACHPGEASATHITILELDKAKVGHEADLDHATKGLEVLSR